MQSPQRAKSLVDIATLSALVVIFDYTLKFSGWKIPFPWFPTLRFDFSGIPIMLSMFLRGVQAGGMTSAVAFFAILVRSADPIGASMKAMAEFATMLGVAPFAMRSERKWKAASVAMGLVLRVVVTSGANLVVLPVVYGWKFPTAVSFLPWLGLFNSVQGSISILGGYLIYEGIAKRMPTLTGKKRAQFY